MAWRRPGDKPLSETMMVSTDVGIDTETNVIVGSPTPWDGQGEAGGCGEFPRLFVSPN